ncbi:MAG TPA: TraR/DksA C4-type zinc finger protein [Verrucomicrobiae bacterium]|nr:TraR/DksA C4-type zinc finger protein [Verrucomicrobiae bacterium]
MDLKARGKASTLEILGNTNANGHVPGKWAALYARLSDLREAVLAKRDLRTQSAQVDLATPGEHIADAATDAYERDWALALASSDQDILFEIDQALDRLRNGTYGRCELTNQPIEPARLRAIPWTRYSTNAQAELESRGAGSRTHIAPAGLVQFPETADTAEEEEENPSRKLREAA